MIGPSRDVFLTLYCPKQATPHGFVIGFSLQRQMCQHLSPYPLFTEAHR